MAIRYFTATTGNWSTASNWDNYSLLGVPGVGVNAGVSDDVYSNAKTVFIDVDINIGNGYIRNGNPGSPVLLTQGPFIVSNNISITGNAINDAGGSGAYLIRNSGSTKTVNFFGNIIGSISTSYLDVYTFDNYGILNFSGLCYQQIASIAPVIYNRPTGVISADSISITGSNFYTIVDTSTASTPSVYYINSATRNGCYTKTSTSSAFIYGNFLLNGSSSSFQPFFNNTGGGTLTISGNTGFTGATSSGTITGTSANNMLVNNANGTVNVYGDIIMQDVGVLRGSSTATGGVLHNSSTNGTVNIYGNLYGSNNGTTSTGALSCAYNVSTGIINISANTISGGSSNGNNFTFDGVGTGGGAIVLNLGAGIVNITANTISTSSGAYYVGVYNNTGNVNVTANTFNLGTGNNSHLFFNVSNATGTFTINSPINGVNTRTTGIAGSGGGALLYNSGGITSRINFVGGNLICGYGTNTTIWNASTGTINVTGTSIIGGFGNGGTINNVSTGIINISGTSLISGGTSFSSTNANLILNQGNGVVNVTLPDGVNSYFYGANGSGSYTISNLGTSGTTNIFNPYSLNIYGGQTVSGNAITVISNYGASGVINITGGGITNIVNNNNFAGDYSTDASGVRGHAIGCYNGTINITGGTVNITGGTGASNGCIVTRNLLSNNINITGLNSLVVNPTGTSATCYGIYHGGTGTINITSNNIDAYGGNGSNNHMIYNTSTGTINVNGIKNIYLGSGNTTYGIYNTSTSPINISGLTTISGGGGSGTNMIYTNNNSVSSNCKININNQDELNLILNPTISGIAGNVIYNNTLNVSAGITITGSGVTNIINKNTITGAHTAAEGHGVVGYLGTLIITGGTVNITGGTGANNNCIMGRFANNVNLVITGLNSLVPNPSGTSADCYGIHNNSNGTVDVTANNIDVYGGNGTNNHIIYHGNIGTTFVNGIKNTYLGSGATSYSVLNGGTGTLNVTANTLSPGSGTTSYGIYNQTTGRINVVVNNIGPSNIYGNHSVYNLTTGRIDINTTTISASSLLNTYSIYSTTAGIINVTADTISSSNNTPAIYSTNATATNNIVYGNLNFTNGVSPVYFVPNATSKLVANTSSNTYLSILGTDNNYKTFASSGFTGLNPFVLPVSGNVRSNIIYGYSASTTSFTGTSIVPLASAVTYGTLFDNTTGTSIISVYDFGNSLTKSGQTV
jgi:hypothetical protein